MIGRLPSEGTTLEGAPALLRLPSADVPDAFGPCFPAFPPHAQAKMSAISAVCRMKRW
jgi:hypothetical protein